MTESVIYEGVSFRHSSESLLPQPPIDWLLEGLLSRKSVAVLAGDAGSKKTYTGIDPVSYTHLTLPTNREV